jgi:hypothetical protein
MKHEQGKEKGDKDMSKKQTEIPLPYFSFSIILEIEDYLQEKGVFIKNIDGTVAHMEAYGTIVNFDRLSPALMEGLYTTEQWTYAVNYWLSNPNVGPPAKIVAKFIQII